MATQPFPSHEDIFPNIQTKSPLAQPEAILSQPERRGWPPLPYNLLSGNTESAKVPPPRVFSRLINPSFFNCSSWENTHSPDPSPALLPSSGHTPASQCLSCCEGLTEDKIWGVASPAPSSKGRHFPHPAGRTILTSNKMIPHVKTLNLFLGSEGFS